MAATFQEGHRYQQYLTWKARGVHQNRTRDFELMHDLTTGEVNRGMRRELGSPLAGFGRRTDAQRAAHTRERINVRREARGLALPHPDASNQELGPNLGGVDALAMPGDGLPSAGESFAIGGTGILIIAALAFLLLSGGRK